MKRETKFRVNILQVYNMHTHTHKYRYRYRCIFKGRPMI